MKLGSPSPARRCEETGRSGTEYPCDPRPGLRDSPACGSLSGEPGRCRPEAGGPSLGRRWLRGQIAYILDRTSPEFPGAAPIAGRPFPPSRSGATGVVTDGRALSELRIRTGRELLRLLRTARRRPPDVDQRIPSRSGGRGLLARFPRLADAHRAFPPSWLFDRGSLARAACPFRDAAAALSDRQFRNFPVPRACRAEQRARCDRHESLGAAEDRFGSSAIGFPGRGGAGP